MVRLLILGCVLLSYFVNINTLSQNDEVEVGFRDLFNRALPENDAVDSDQTSVVYRRPRYAGCLKCNNFGRLPLRPLEKQGPPRRPPPGLLPEYKARPKLCLACGKYLSGSPLRPPLRRPPLRRPLPIRKPCQWGCRNGARGPDAKMFSKIKALANRVSTTILKWLQKKTA